MTAAIEPTPLTADGVAPLLSNSAMAMAGIASLGAGAIHAAAAGSHSEHRQAVLAFVIVAAFQLGWGALALVRFTSLIALAGVAGNGAALGGWLMAKSSGISFVDGLEAAEGIQFADTLAAAFALLAVVGAIVAFWRGPVRRGISSFGMFIVAVAGVGVAVLTLPAMVSAGGHSHAHGGTDDHGAHTTAPADGGSGSGESAAGGSGASDAASDGHDHSDEGATDAATGGTAPPPAVVPPVPYDPTKPIDLGGVPGVTPEQQAKAENLIAITLARLPKFADPAVAESLGWRSIGDALTGHEHYINWDLIDDGKVLDPDFPESLVYEVRGDERTLVSAMFMLPTGSTLDTVPEMGGALMQWHIHDNLCFTPLVDGQARVISVTDSEGSCRIGEKFTPVPMIHVWITPHPCGPFAALEGVGAGQVKEGEEHACDHLHGAGF
ncbi:MAG TPA: hypothetical protein VIT64_01125 [Ilumatobacteraceae bacterium]